MEPPYNVLEVCLNVVKEDLSTVPQKCPNGCVKGLRKPSNIYQLRHVALRAREPELGQQHPMTCECVIAGGFHKGLTSMEEGAAGPDALARALSQSPGREL